MKPLLLILSLMVRALAQSQNYSIDFFTIDGGGGTSSGGQFSLVGTIGQPDAGKLTGGNYVLDGGFLSGIFVVPTLGSPALSVQQSGINAIISWPLDSSTGFILEQATDLTSPISWSASSITVTTNGNQRRVTIPATGGWRFFRLRKP